MKPNEVRMSDSERPSCSGTTGKRSPNGCFLEYAFNRDIAARVASELTSPDLVHWLQAGKTVDIGSGVKPCV